MLNLNNLTAAAIIRIPEHEPERLFSGPAAIKGEFRQLAQHWHPDRRPHDPEATQVFAHLTKLRDRAEEKAAQSVWDVPGESVITDKDGRRWRVPYRRKHRFEIGEMIYGPKVLAFLIDRPHSAIFQPVPTFAYANDSMKTEVDKYLPHERWSFIAQDGRSVLVLDKTKDVFLLRDVVAACGGTMDSKHVAWIVSALLNITCYLEYAGLTHNAISADTCFVSPDFHSVMLYGGWWYAAKIGDPIKYLPAFAHAYAPSDMLRSKRASSVLDRILIRVLARQLLDDATGMTLIAKGVPAPMVAYLRSSPSASAVDDYRSWRTCLEKSFGARRFVKLDISESAIFTED